MFYKGRSERLWRLAVYDGPPRRTGHIWRLLDRHEGTSEKWSIKLTRGRTQHRTLDGRSGPAHLLIDYDNLNFIAMNRGQDSTYRAECVRPVACVSKRKHPRAYTPRAHWASRARSY